MVDKPHHISDMSPSLVQGVELHDGDWGSVGAMQVWKYTHGKNLDLISSLFPLLVTWTFEYEKLIENIPDPNTLMDNCINLTKDIEIYHLK
nr:MLP-like protein 28 [Coffea arabica]